MGIMEDFELFWDKYPKHDAKRLAMVAYGEAIRRGADPQEIMDGIDKSPRLKNEPRYIPQAGNWLNSDGWLDEPEDDIKRGNADNVLLLPESREEREQNLRNQKDFWSS